MRLSICRDLNPPPQASGLKFQPSLGANKYTRWTRQRLLIAVMFVDCFQSPLLISLAACRLGLPHHPLPVVVTFLSSPPSHLKSMCREMSHLAEARGASGFTTSITWQASNLMYACPPSLPPPRFTVTLAQVAQCVPLATIATSKSRGTHGAPTCHGQHLRLQLTFAWHACSPTLATSQLPSHACTGSNDKGMFSFLGSCTRAHPHHDLVLQSSSYRWHSA